ncbi:hypothetical protein [Pontibacter sp. G13]|uniref:hypothetical protein n=1 Tax=Pontibacter sp. G13 TaxID=3074898 RepID=UPI00288BD00E|nr:hypothetical protein [Pontibacter sp. G13]WNJ20045.1 hypothetical protein RJD25_06135 [Pontibacter sp. G13]
MDSFTACVSIPPWVKRFGASALLVCSLADPISAQSGEFEIEGDLLGSPGMKDDWFTSPQGGSGLFPSILPPSLFTEPSQNAAWMIGMEHAPYSQVRGNEWIAGWYARDQHTAQGAVDETVFIEGSSKNAMVPSQWDATAGNVPAKNDIIDALAHMRRSGQDGQLYFYGGVATRSGSGNSHVDFEFFQAPMSFQGGSFISQGSQNGRTPLQLNSDGTIAQLGDLICSVDFTQGGKKLSTEIRIWLNPQHLPGGSLSSANQLANLPFEFTGAFTTHPTSQGFGYAEIKPWGSNSPVVWVAGNGDQEVDSPPWGTWSGPQATMKQTYECHQFMEVGLNLSALGLDGGNKAPWCQSVCNTLMIKTRASQSFPAQLKDFVGPYSFGRPKEVRLEVSVPTITCDQAVVSPSYDDQFADSDWHWCGPEGYRSEEAYPIFTRPGTYIATVSGGAGCQLTDTFEVKADLEIPVFSTEGGTITCAEPLLELAAISAMDSLAFEWYDPAGEILSEQSPSVSDAGSYRVIGTLLRNGCRDTAFAEVTVDTLAPIVQLDGGILTCQAPTLTLHPIATPDHLNFSFQWAHGPATQTATVQTPGTFTLTVTHPQNGCQTEATSTVVSNQTAPDISASGGALDCATPTVTIRGNGADLPHLIGQWTGPSGFQSTESEVSVSTSGTYTWRVTDTDNGCQSTAFAQVIGNHAPLAISIGSSGNLNCRTNQSTLTASCGSAQVNWAWTLPDGSTASTPQIVASEPGWYKLRATETIAGCQAQDSIFITRTETYPTFVLTVPSLLTCLNPRVLLRPTSPAGAVYAYRWTLPSGFQAAGSAIFASQPGTYIVEAQDVATGCTSRDTVEVVADLERPAVSVEGGGISCLEPSTTIRATLDENAGYTYYWVGPGGFSSTDLSPTIYAPGTYTLVVRDPQNGCQTTAPVTISDDRSPIVASLSSGMITCRDSQVTFALTLAAQDKYQFAWEGPNGFTSNEAEPTVDEPGIYTLTIDDPETGCSRTLSAQVILMNQPPTVHASTTGQLSCVQTQVFVLATTGSGNYTYEWQGPDGMVGTDRFSAVTIPGTYTVSVTHAQTGCTAEASVDVGENYQVPHATIRVSDSLSCKNPSVQLGVSAQQGTYRYAWTGPQGFAAFTANPAVQQPGTYTLVLTDQTSGCDTTLTIEVTGDPNPIELSAIGGTLTCKDTVVKLTGALSDTTWETTWTGPNGFLSDQKITLVTTPGTYYFTATDPISGCMDRVPVVVPDGTAEPLVQLFAGTLGCEGSSANLGFQTYTKGDFSFEWTGPENFQSSLASPEVSEPGTYTLTLQDSTTGCVAVRTLNLQRTIPDPMLRMLVSGSLTCSKPTARIYPVTRIGTFQYQWTGPNGFTSQAAFPEVAESGTYRVTLLETQTLCRYEGTAEVISMKETPVVSLTEAGTLTCRDSSFELTLSGENLPQYQINWSSPSGQVSGERQILVKLPGAYSVTVMDLASQCDTTISREVKSDLEAPALDSVFAENLTCRVPIVTVSASGTGDFRWMLNEVEVSRAASFLTEVAGTYRVYSTIARNGCSSSAAVTVLDLRRDPMVYVQDAQLNCDGDAIIPSISIQAPEAYSVKWSGPEGFSSSTEAPQLMTAGTYIVRIMTLEAGCEASDTLILSPAEGCLLDIGCSMTQGFYGNEGGKFIGQTPTKHLLMELLKEPLVLGYASATFTLKQDDIDCFFFRMPGGGPARPLSAKATCSDPVGISLTRSGQFGNSLLTQALTLGLNLRLTPELAHLKITGTAMVTQAMDMSTLPPTPIPGAFQRFLFPESVVRPDDPMTVGELFELVNIALSHPKTQAIAYSDLVQAMAAINEGFDECRKLVAFQSPDPNHGDCKLRVWPNPTAQQEVTFEIIPHEDGQLRLEVYDPHLGIPISVPYEGDGTTSQREIVRFSTESLRSGHYYYRLTQNGHTLHTGMIQVVESY